MRVEPCGRDREARPRRGGGRDPSREIPHVPGNHSFSKLHPGVPKTIPGTRCSRRVEPAGNMVHTGVRQPPGHRNVTGQWNWATLVEVLQPPGREALPKILVESVAIAIVVRVWRKIA